MASVKPRGNRSTEQALRFRLVQAGISGWRLHAIDLPGCPDFAFDLHKLAVYVDGCFWHGCPQHCRKPKTNTEYWLPKLERNKHRDRRNRLKIRRAGWRVIRIWEHDLKNPAKTLRVIKKALEVEVK